MKYYAVATGRVPGIYEEWTGLRGAHAQVDGWKGAVYKSFKTREEAEQWLTGHIGGTEPEQAEQAKPAEKPVRPKATHRKIIIKPDPLLRDNEYTLYTDGGCKNNPGPGGYGVVIVTNREVTEVSGGYQLTTNNRMELMACIAGLEQIPAGSTATLVTDSEYVAKAINTGWVKKEGYIASDRLPGEDRLNHDLWSRLILLLRERTVRFNWVRGHSGHPGNERCDQLATIACRKEDLPIDEGYKG